MPYLLDTNICSRSLKARPGARIHTRLAQASGQLYVSRLTCAELYALGYRAHAKELERIEDLLSDFSVLDFDEPCAREYGRLHARLAERGLKVVPTDLMIAATALVHGLALVTHDKDFENIIVAVPELRLDDWLT